MFYDLACNTWGEEETNAIQKVLDSQMFTMGTNVEKFEKDFAAKFQKRYALMVSSGSMANQVGIGSLFFKKENPLKRGDEVIVPAIAWATTYYPLQHYGLKMKIIDVDLATLNSDVSLLEKALTKKTKMVVAVSVLGNPAPLDKLRAFCDKHGLYLFEDNCESMGAQLNGKPCGTFGDLNTFSTFFSHHISTMEGGVILTDDLELYHLCRSLRAHGWTRNLPAESPIYKPKEDDFFEAYRFILPGYNARPLELAGAVGVEQLKKLDKMVEIRRKNAKLFVELFKDDDRVIIQKENGKSSWFSFTLILNPSLKLTRKDILPSLAEAKIGFRIITGGNILRHDVIKYFDYECVGKIKNADIAHDRGFFVGNHPQDLTAQITRLREVIDHALDSKSGKTARRAA
jgi:CDP-4-dehydro-6-deoxyglucose reductase, E1